MSMTTIVTIVLVVVTLVLALVLIRTIFQSGTSAIEQIDSSIQNEINNLFSSEGKSLVIYPGTRQIAIRRGDDAKGFAFSIENPDPQVSSFEYSLVANDVSKCGSAFTKETADSYILGGTGVVTLGASAILDNAILIKFVVPGSATKCPIVYTLNVNSTASGYPTSTNIFVTIK